MALTLVCGLSFSGKSTLARQLTTRLDGELIGLDSINLERGLHGGQGIPLEEWDASNQIARRRAAAHLSGGREVIVDDTGSPRFIRDAWRETAQSCDAPFVLVWVQIDERLLRRRRDANRAAPTRHDITDEVLATHLATFEVPVGECAIRIDARDTRDPLAVEAIVDAIRGARH